MKDTNKKNPDARRIWGICILLFIIILTVFYAVNYLDARRTLNSLSISDGAHINRRTLRITFENHGYFHPLRFYLDGEDITREVRYAGKSASLDLMLNKDGNHRLIVGVSHRINHVTFLPLEKIINFTVDTIPPHVAISSPRSELVSNREILLEGETEPNCSVTIKVNDRPLSAGIRRDGSFMEKIHLDREVNNITILATDPAGNSSFASHRVILDDTPPEIVMLSPGLGQILNRNSATLSAFMNDTGSGLADYFFEIDDVRIDGRYDPRDGTFTAVIERLDEGRYDVTAVAVDRSGLVSRSPWSFVVNTTDEPGLHAIRPGAMGGDVRAVQGRLVNLGYLDDDQVTGVFDDTTTMAVRKLQLDRNLSSDGIVNRETLMALSNKINIYLDEFSLYLISPDDQVIRHYPIACGSPYYPTPPGHYHVLEKVYHPAWYPPPSPWARGKKPAPPGPGNPLGTRWIGLNAEILGIHGTPESWSIGSAASHGCIRMYIHQVEELFELICIGTPVNIFSSRPIEHEKYRVEEEEEKNTTASMN